MNKKPIIFSIDDDPQVLKSIKRDLRNKYKEDYKISHQPNQKDYIAIYLYNPIRTLKAVPDGSQETILSLPSVLHVRSISCNFQGNSRALPAPWLIVVILLLPSICSLVFKWKTGSLKKVGSEFSLLLPTS